MLLLGTAVLVVLVALVWAVCLRRPRHRPPVGVDGAASDGGSHHSREREDSWDGDSADSGGGGDGGGNGGD